MTYPFFLHDFNRNLRAFCAVWIAISLASAPAAAQNHTHAPESQYRLTARPWSPTGLGPEDALEAVERLCRFAIKHQDPQGAFIDPILDREFQYATPYLAYAIGTLVDAGRADDMLPNGVRAMDHATRLFARGNDAIPDRHGEFFIAPLTEAIDRYAAHVDAATVSTWRERLQTPIEAILEDLQMKTNNWRTYAMKGQWLRYRNGRVPRERAVAFVEDGWRTRTQRSRMFGTRHFLYQDWNGDPQSHAVEAVGRGNLLALVVSGYDGPSESEIRNAVTAATRHSLLLHDPTGQCPPNGRTDNHVFNDVLYALIFGEMAEHERASGNPEAAGVYRRAAALGLESIRRWWRDDAPWDGSLSITKNFFDPAQRVGYQPASQYSNYTGAEMYHLAELAHAMKTHIDERPAPSDIGGYAVVNDAAFGSAVMNAGGMQVFCNLRGDSVPKYGKYWTPLGIVRLSRADWSSPVGLYDGEHDAQTRTGLSLAPTWPLHDEDWVRLAERPRDYRGVFSPGVRHPLVVRGRVLFAPVTGVGGPTFAMDLTVVPDGVLITLTSANTDTFGLTLPVTADNGRTKAHIDLRDTTLRAQTDSGGDRLTYHLIEGERIVEDGDAVQGTYGWLKPYRAIARDGRVTVFVRLANADEPRMQTRSLRLIPGGFEAPFATLAQNLYRGAHAAGGFTDTIDLNNDGLAELTLDPVCGVITQTRDGAIVRVETDRPATLTFKGTQLQTEAFSPVALSR